jgi:tetratricopeptide (TPR) repeat protein
MLLALTATAQVSFTATAERTAVSSGEQATVVATLVSHKAVNSPPRPAQNDAFDLLGVNTGQSQSYKVNMVNGAFQQTREYIYRYIYTISPKVNGTFTFPALTVNIDGEEYSTRPIQFNSDGPPPPRSADVTASILLSKKTLYPGEQAILTLKVAQKANTSINTQRGYAGALEEIEKTLGKEFSLNRLFTNQITQGQERIGSETYNVYTLKYSVFGLTAGTYTIPSINFEYDEIQQSGRRRSNPFFSDFFDMDFFGGGTQAVRRGTRTTPISITVKPLPAGAPANFGGSVGKFSLTAAVEPPSVPAGEALTLKITLKGNSRTSNIGDPVLPELKNCDVFTPERQTTVDTSADGLSTRKTYRYLIIPKREGTLALGPVTYPYLDPGSGTYKTAASDSLRVTVTTGKSVPKEQTRYLTQEEIQQVGQDIRYIKTGGKIAHQTERPYRAPYWYLLFPLPFLIFLFTLVHKLHSKHSGENLSKNIRQKALANAVRELHNAGKGGTDKEFLGKSASVIEKYISHKFAFPATGRTLEELQGELLSRRIDEQTVTGLAALIQGIDEYRFGGKTFNSQSRGEIINQTIKFLSSMEKTVQKEKSPASQVSSIIILLAMTAAAVSPAAVLADNNTDANKTAGNVMTITPIVTPEGSDTAPASGNGAAASIANKNDISGGAGGNAALFHKANELYAANLYDSALVYYTKILEGRAANAAVYYNLGNCYYRLAKPGMARLYYEKAAILSPTDADIQANIRFIKSVIVDRSEDTHAESDFITAVLYGIHTLLPLQTQLAVLCALLFALSVFGSFMLVKRGLARLWLGYGAALCTLLILTVGISAGYKIYALESKQYAIILTESLDAKNQPMGDQTLFTAHEGTKVQIRKGMGEWSLVSLSNGASGWVTTASVGKI